MAVGCSPRWEVRSVYSADLQPTRLNETQEVAGGPQDDSAHTFSLQER